MEQTHARLQAESDSLRPILEEKAVALAEAFNERRADAVAAFYAPDGVLMPPDMPAAIGPESIEAAIAADFARTPPGAVIAFAIESVTANGPIGVERGTWKITMAGPDGGPVELHGKYLVEWHKLNGEWRIAADIWNADAPIGAM